MKRTLLATLLTAVVSLTGMAVEVKNVKVTTTPLGELTNTPERVPYSSTTRDVLVNENFELLTNGTMTAPDFDNPLASLEGDVAIDPALMHGEQWYGHKVYQAGGALAMKTESMDQAILNTPRNDYSGSVRITFMARALPTEWVGEEGNDMTDMSATLMVGIADEQGRKLDVNVTKSNLADLRLYADMGWTEVNIEFDNYSAYNGVSIIFAGYNTLLLDDIKVTTSSEEFIAAPYVTGVTDMTDNSFTIHWEKVRKSYNYYVWLYSVAGTDPETGEEIYQIEFPKELLQQIASSGMTVEEYIEDMGGADSPYLKYDIVNRHGDLSYTFKDLDPNKDYLYGVMSHNVNQFSEKKLHKIMEIPTPVIAEPTEADFTETSFTGQWNNVSKADYYEVNLYGVKVVEEDNEDYPIFFEDFDKTSNYSNATNLAEATPCTSTMTMADVADNAGWDINGPLAMEIPEMGEYPLCYMLDGWFGVGMNMTVSSPAIYVGNGDKVNLEMHLQCDNADAPIVMQFANSMYMAEMGGAKEVEAMLELPTNGEEQTKFELACMDQEGLPLYIDYISITQALYEGDLLYSSLSSEQLANGENTVVFSDLDKEPYDVFAYTVTAVKNDGRRSAPSARMLFDFNKKSAYDGIDEIKTDAKAGVVEVARYSLDGRLLDAPTPGINIVRYSDGSSSKVLIK